MSCMFLYVCCLSWLTLQDEEDVACSSYDSGKNKGDAWRLQYTVADADVHEDTEHSSLELRREDAALGHL